MNKEKKDIRVDFDWAAAGVEVIPYLGVEDLREKTGFEFSLYCFDLKDYSEKMLGDILLEAPKKICFIPKSKYGPSLDVNCVLIK